VIKNINATKNVHVGAITATPCTKHVIQHIDHKISLLFFLHSSPFHNWKAL